MGFGVVVVLRELTLVREVAGWMLLLLLVCWLVVGTLTLLDQQALAQDLARARESRAVVHFTRRSYGMMR